MTWNGNLESSYTSRTCLVNQYYILLRGKPLYPMHIIHQVAYTDSYEQRKRGGWEDVRIHREEELVRIRIVTS